MNFNLKKKSNLAEPNQPHSSLIWVDSNFVKKYYVNEIKQK